MKLYTVEIIDSNILISTQVKAENPDEAFWLLYVEFQALGQYNMDTIRMRILHEQELLPSI